MYFPMFIIAHSILFLKNVQKIQVYVCTDGGEEIGEVGEGKGVKLFFEAERVISSPQAWGRGK